MKTAILLALSALPASAEVRIAATDGVRALERARDAMRSAGRPDTVAGASFDPIPVSEIGPRVKRR